MWWNHITRESVLAHFTYCICLACSNVIYDCILVCVCVYHEFRWEDDFLCGVIRCEVCCIKKQCGFLCNNIHTIYYQETQLNLI